MHVFLATHLPKVLHVSCVKILCFPSKQSSWCSLWKKRVLPVGLEMYRGAIELTQLGTLREVLGSVLHGEELVDPRIRSAELSACFPYFLYVKCQFIKCTILN